MNKPTFGTYRGWSIQDNGWVYGNKVETIEGVYLVDIHSLDVSHRFSGEYHNGIHCGLEDEGIEDKYEACDHGCEVAQEIYDDEIFSGFVKVHPESLGMFTGQYDTEDKPIYTNIPLPDGTMSRGGDIVSNFRLGLDSGLVYYDKCSFWVRFISCKHSKHQAGHCMALYDCVGDVVGKCEIIGNAYENPELLEGEG